jgi:hypothetical protein
MPTMKKSVRSRGNVNPKNSFPLAELDDFNFLPYWWSIGEGVGRAEDPDV